MVARCGREAEVVLLCHSGNFPLESAALFGISFGDKLGSIHKQGIDQFPKLRCVFQNFIWGGDVWFIIGVGAENDLARGEDNEDDARPFFRWVGGTQRDGLNDLWDGFCDNWSYHGGNVCGGVRVTEHRLWLCLSENLNILKDTANNLSRSFMKV